MGASLLGLGVFGSRSLVPVVPNRSDLTSTVIGKICRGTGWTRNELPVDIYRHSMGSPMMWELYREAGADAGPAYIRLAYGHHLNRLNRPHFRLESRIVNAPVFELSQPSLA